MGLRKRAGCMGGLGWVEGPEPLNVASWAGGSAARKEYIGLVLDPCFPMVFFFFFSSAAIVFVFILQLQSSRDR
jgi:hypothetical protein